MVTLSPFLFSRKVKHSLVCVFISLCIIYRTKILIFAAFPLEVVAVMVADPVFKAVTLPVFDTSATAEFELL